MHKPIAHPNLPQDRLLAMLHYEPATGVFTWRENVSPHVKAGHRAGHIHSLGYRLVGIDGKLIRASRLAWFYMTGEWPMLEVDHIDRVRDNDSWTNLRTTDRTGNNRNVGARRNKSGFAGVHQWRNKWRACIKVERKMRHLGMFDTPEDAHRAYLDAKCRLHGVGASHAVGG